MDFILPMPLHSLLSCIQMIVGTTLFSCSSTIRQILMRLQWYSMYVSSCNNPSRCSLQEFQRLVEPLIPSNWEEECGLPSLCDNGVVVALAVLFAVSGTILVICCVVLSFICYRHRRRKPKYSIVPDSEPSL